MSVIRAVLQQGRGAARMLLLLLLAGLSVQAFAVSCSVAATALAFGPYNPMSGNSVASTANVTVTCGTDALLGSVSVNVTLSSGSSGSFLMRSMQVTGGTMQYQIYRDLLHSSVWGDGSGGSSVNSAVIVLSALSASQANWVAYGYIPPSQSTVKPGSYGDSILVQITY